MRKAAVFLALALILGCRSAAPVAGMPHNFGVVEEGRIYRGAQPSSADLEALQRRGVRTILKVNSDDLQSERATAARLGMQLVYVPLSARTVGRQSSCADVQRAYAVLTDPAAWPVYVHCTHGRDRTGFLVGLFREREERWDWPRVSDELTRYGHDSAMRLVFPNISRSLEAGVPACR